MARPFDGRQAESKYNLGAMVMMRMLQNRAGRNRIAGAAGLLVLVVVALPSCSERSANSVPAGDLTVAEVVDKAIVAIGGRKSLLELESFTLNAKRVPFMTGQGPFAGTGILAFPVTEARVTHDLARKSFRLDMVRTWAARDGGIDEFESTELVIGHAGYASEDDLFRVTTERDQAMTPERVSAAIKTETLLNPHMLLKNLLRDPTIASLGSASDAVGWRLSDDQVLPITLERVRNRVDSGAFSRQGDFGRDRFAFAQ